MNRPKPPDEVYFPVVPMLDMSFQLLAFFIMTFQAPTRETRIDLDLPVAPVALPRSAETAAAAPDVIGLESDLIVRAGADSAGRLASLRLDEAPVSGADELADRLTRYVRILQNRPLRVSLLADDGLSYEEAARLIGACSKAGVQAVRLSPMTGNPGPPRNDSK